MQHFKSWCGLVTVSAVVSPVSWHFIVAPVTVSAVVTPVPIRSMMMPIAIVLGL